MNKKLNKLRFAFHIILFFFLLFVQGYDHSTNLVELETYIQNKTLYLFKYLI